MRQPYRLARARCIQDTIARLPRLERRRTGRPLQSKAEPPPDSAKQRDDLVRRRLRAWTNGDLDALETVLDRGDLRWIEPGEWDCIGREEVLRLLRQRAAATPPTRCGSNRSTCTP